MAAKLKAHKSIMDLILFSIGVCSAAFGLRGFLLPNGFIDGGVTGISLIISGLSEIPLSILLVAINLPFVILAFTQIGRSFAVKSIFAILGLATVVHFVPFPVVTSDKLLVATFGGFFLGAGIGIAIRGGAVLDGTEVLALYFSRKTGAKIGDIILIFNIIIFSVGAYVISVEVALYAILTYIVAAKAVDFIIRGIEEYTGITIISPFSEQIRLRIVENLGRGVTQYEGKGGYDREGKGLKSYNILYTVVTRLEVAQLQAEIDDIDANAFVIMSSIKDTRGGMIKRLGMHQ